ncbi:MAG TPA: hypothetical protein VLJ39_21175 [Tepidisphaeraceae bacterium]|nr:hypothetical protein [Tepidisphaeraceae bacterium]
MSSRTRQWNCIGIFVAALALCGSAARAAEAAPAARELPADRDQVVAELQDDTAPGVDRRLGPGYSAFHPDGGQPAPDIYLAPTRQDPGGRPYQIGGPWTRSGGDFSSTQGQVLYVPDAPDTFPVDRVTITEWSNNTWSECPEPPWHGGFRPEPASRKWLQATAGKSPGLPRAIARGYGGWANCGVVIFSHGLVATAGTVTARGLEPTFQLPPSKLPTAVSVTNKSEFALVTVCDTRTHRGQLAVFAMQVNGKKTRFVHEWQDDSAWGLPSVGLFTDMKLLGYVDLPGIEFPTGVCAVGNHEGGRMNGRDGNAGLLREYDLARQADRDVFLTGPNAGYSSTTGFALVAGKYENKVAFVNLRPLFQKVREMYFTTDANYRKTREAGKDPGQWPYTFEADPAWAPQVVSVIDVPHPTAVLASLSGGADARALIASLDGTLSVYTAGGLATGAAANPADIKPVGQVRIGRNPTRLTYQKGSRDTVLACSRGDAEIEWVQYRGKGVTAPTVIRRLRDARLRDPVDLEVADTHGVEASLVTVVDFLGRQVVNYRYSKVVFATQGGARFGMGADGKAEFECGGVMEFPGKPFAVSASNVN